MAACLGVGAAQSVWAQDLAAPTVTVSGEVRARLEGLDGQFRAGGSGGDQFFALRSLLQVEVDFGNIGLVAQVQDARGYLDNGKTPLSTSLVNPLDLLQLHLDLPLPEVLGPGSRTRLQLGRQAVGIGSQRQIERQDYANVIRGYTGAHVTATTATGDVLHALLVVPQARLPSDRTLLGTNALEMDKEQWNRRIWALHYFRADLFGPALPGVQAEAFVYGLSETDSARFPTPNRQIATPGVRLFRAVQRGRWDLDIEGAVRFGTRRATSAPGDEVDLDVRAAMLFARVGHTFDHDWRPNAAVQYYYASGDGDPGDKTFGQFERLFGARRGDLNNTSIHGPLTPANLSAIGIRLEAAPTDRFDARLTYSAAYLASATDSWVVGRLRDPTGRSGSFIGHVIDSRMRYRLLPAMLELELGASALVFGEFVRNVPNGPEGNLTLFGYAQLTFGF